MKLLYLLLTLNCAFFAFGFNYSRELIQLKHPEFGHDWVPMGQTADGELIVGYLSLPANAKLIPPPAPKDSATFTLFTRAHPNGTLITQTIKNYANIFDKTKPVKFVTHGWMSSGSADTCVSIKNGFLKKYDANVFILDWNEIAGNPFYPIPMAATKDVGDFYSAFLNDVVDFGVDPKNIHLVGHSLGAHVSGFAARGMKKSRPSRVTGLDPALPGFRYIFLTNERLNLKDADFVDIIHSCAGFLGIDLEIGHADFFPNGGSVPQPGCETLADMVEACSHGRSWKYFAASLVNNVPFLSYPCRSYQQYSSSNGCTDEGGIEMGDGTPVSARGKYYLRTDDEPPYVILDEVKNNN